MDILVWYILSIGIAFRATTLELQYCNEVVDFFGCFVLVCIRDSSGAETVRVAGMQRCLDYKLDRGWERRS